MDLFSEERDDQGRIYGAGIERGAGETRYNEAAGAGAERHGHTITPAKAGVRKVLKETGSRLPPG